MLLSGLNPFQPEQKSISTKAVSKADTSVNVSNILFRNQKIVVRTSKTDIVKNGWLSGE